MGLNQYLVIYGAARITEGGAAELLQRLARTYLGPEVRFPPINNPPPGYITHIEVEPDLGCGSLGGSALTREAADEAPACLQVIPV